MSENHAPEAPVEINRAAINQANARKSTGPKTEAGKNRTRFNAFRHGLTGKTIVMPWQDQAAYEAFSKKLIAGLKPEGPIEEQDAQTIGDCSWRLNSAAAREANLLALAIHERIGQIDSGDEQVDAAFAEAQALREESHVLSNISLYCQRIARQRDNAFAQLRKLQQERKEELGKELHKAGRLRKLHNREEIAFDPSEEAQRARSAPFCALEEDHGFDFSIPEIDARLRRESRLYEAPKAAA